VIDPQHPAHPGWHAELELEFVQELGRTRLARRRHVGPLVVQRTFYPEGPVCHAYIVHPPGGIVGGDRLQLSVVAQSGSQVLLTTPAAGKFYRSGGLQAQQLQEIQLNGASLEWLPQENIYFGDTLARASTCVKLQGNAHFIGWEVACYGRPASGDLFSRGHVSQSMELWRDDRPLIWDHVHVDGASQMMSARWGLADFTTLGTLLAYPASDALVQAVRGIQLEAGLLSCTATDGVLVCRAMHRQAGAVKQALIAAWEILRSPIMNLTAVHPRIWAT
jgi:urease accessory protein